MVNASPAEIYFIAGMFVLIIVISTASTYFFFRTYKREKNRKAIKNQKSKIEN